MLLLLSSPTPVTPRRVAAVVPPSRLVKLDCPKTRVAEHPVDPQVFGNSSTRALSATYTFPPLSTATPWVLSRLEALQPVLYAVKLGWPNTRVAEQPADGQVVWNSSTRLFAESAT